MLGAATVSEAYEIKEYLEDKKEASSQYSKLVNTGTIDPYISLFGSKPTRYIKGAYDYPVISASNLRKISQKRLEQAKAPKIIIGGMTKRLECFLDTQGHYLAGKSTVIVLEKKLDLRFLIGILNSDLMSFFYSVFFNSLSLSGGYLRIGTKQIAMLPIPNSSDHLRGKIAKLAQQCLDAAKDSPNKLAVLETELNQLVYQAYGLTEEEIALVESKA